MRIADARAPIEKLEREYKEFERELNAKISQAQTASQDLNMYADKLETMNKCALSPQRLHLDRRRAHLRCWVVGDHHGAGEGRRRSGLYVRNRFGG